MKCGKKSVTLNLIFKSSHKFDSNCATGPQIDFVINVSYTYPNSACLQDVRLKKLSDFEFNLSRLLMVKLILVVPDSNHMSISYHLVLNFFATSYHLPNVLITLNTSLLAPSHVTSLMLAHRAPWQFNTLSVFAPRSLAVSIQL